MPLDHLARFSNDIWSRTNSFRIMDLAISSVRKSLTTLAWEGERSVKEKMKI
jgi:hypothetical protein